MVQMAKKPSRDKPSARERARRARQRSADTGTLPPAAPYVPQPVKEAPADGQLLTAQAYRSANAFRFALPSRPGSYVIVRRTDLFSLFMADAVPLNLLAVVGDLEKVRDAIQKNPATLAQMSALMRKQLTDAIDRVIVEAVAEPKLTLDPKVAAANPGILHVSEVALSDRLAIFFAANNPPPPGGPDDRAITGGASVTAARVAMETPANAIAFRGSEPAAHGDAAPNGPGVRSAAKLVDVPGVGSCEYAGA
jgi:hypothetical protein